MVGPSKIGGRNRCSRRSPTIEAASDATLVTNSVVTHLFTGRYEVTGADRKKLIGTDGFFQVGLTLDGEASLFAVDT